MPAPEPFLWHTRIRFVDTDSSGRIHYSSLFRHIECAEDEFYRTIGLPYFATPPAALSYPRVHVEADYLLPLLFGSQIAIVVRPTRLGAKSYTLAFDIQLGNQLAATATLVIACMSSATGKSHPLPDSLRHALSPYLTQPSPA